MHANRREAERFKIQLPIAILQQQEISAFAEDISAKGVLLDAGADLRGETLRFIITFPPEITLSTFLRVRCEAQIVRVLERSESHTRAAVRIHRYEFLPRNEEPETPQNAARSREAS